MAKDKRLRVKSPGPGGDRPRWLSVAIIAALGLGVGIAWPSLAGIRIGPQVPGAKSAEPVEPQPSVAPSARPSASLPALAKSAAPAEKTLDAQAAVVSGGRIASCHDGNNKLKPEECGALKIDRVLAPRLQELAGCPSAMGLSGDLELGFDIAFDRKEIAVIKGDKSDVPSTTINGIIACAADYVADVEPEKIPHKYSRYRIFYTLSFYPPGTALPRQGTDETTPDDSDAQRGLASVAWDTALVRDEPSTGKVVARLVRGTRVKILSRRKDWYHVKIRSQEGWVYRGALGL